VNKAIEPKGTRSAAIHEAGHTVAAMAYGMSFESVHVDGELGGLKWMEGDTGGMLTARIFAAQLDAGTGQSDLLRIGAGVLLPSWHVALVINVAGRVAECLDKELDDHGEFLSEEGLEKQKELIRALGGPDPLLRNPFSQGLTPDLGELDDEPGSDFECAAVLCRLIGALTGKDVVEVVAGAEGEAARILMARWEQTHKIACSLLRRRSGRMTVYRLVGDVEAPLSPERPWQTSRPSSRRTSTP
jgi:hypothetical protein